MKTFLAIWFGQLVSMTGTAMTRFALLTWAYRQTGEATTLALLGFFSYILYIAFSPIAGVVVDRWDRRTVMLAGDLSAGLMTVGMLALYLADGLQIWHLYLAEALTGAFEAFQHPAYNAAITTLVPERQYGRVNGLRSLAYSSSQVVAPSLAGVVLVAVGLPGVMMIDIATFLIATLTLAQARIPRPAATAEGQASRGKFWQEVRFGFRYVFARRGLLYLLFIFMGINFAASLTYFGVLPAMILARSGNDELALAGVQSVLGAAGVIGGALVSAWGGPKRRVHGVLLGGALSFLFGDLMFGVGQSLPVWIGAGFVSAVFIPLIVSSDRAIWQSKVEPDVQGRVFAAKGMLQQMPYPIGYLLAGPLADRLFGPAMMPGGALASVFGSLVGTGPGAGMGLMFLCTSLIGTTVCLGGYLIPAVRRLDLDDCDWAGAKWRGITEAVGD
ncbi:MAG: MFS transporter [Anaerolineae bacterium]|nr:MFS transporter [Anaerolineae bacterium]